MNSTDFTQLTNTSLSAQERALCAVCADVLSTGIICIQLFFLAALALLLATISSIRWSNSPALLLTLFLLVCAQGYCAIRVALDARLLNRLAQGSLPNLQLLDAGLIQILSVSQHKTGRDLFCRLKGAMRWYQAQVISLFAVLLLNIFAWWPRLCRHKISAQRAMQRTWTAAKKELLRLA